MFCYFPGATIAGIDYRSSVSLVAHGQPDLLHKK